jgi:hypothetical protein
MLTTEQNESTYRVRYSSYVIPLIFLSLVPLMLIEYGSSLLDGSIETDELIGLSSGVLLPLTVAYFFIEFASFTFSVESGLFSWRWRNLISSKNGEVPLSRIVKVRRDALESGGRRRPAVFLPAAGDSGRQHNDSTHTWLFGPV